MMTKTSLTDQILALSKADATEVFIAERERNLTRFANSEIHQNVTERDTVIRVRVVKDGRVGVAATNRLSEQALSDLVARAEMLARHARPLAHVPTFPGLQHYSEIPTAYDERTSRMTAQERAEVAGVICRLTVEAGLNAFGAIETSTGRMTVANSQGLFATQAATKTDVGLVVMGEDSSGFSSYASSDVAGLNGEMLARVAIDKALRGVHPVAIDPGEYTVFLEEEAVADLIEHVSDAGFGGQDFLDGKSFMAGNLGERILGENVTIWDDPLASDMLPVCFDAEGMPKGELMLIEQGIARAVTHDLETASLAGLTSTGHAAPAPNPKGPFPSHLRMAPGQTPRSELLKGIERGIWVTRFHYTNLAEFHTATLTGMTRDGTYLIEHGVLTRPLKNLRFTTGGLEALLNVRGISQETKLCMNSSVGTRAPALVVEGFRFSGVTQF